VYVVGVHQRSTLYEHDVVWLAGVCSACICSRVSTEKIFGTEL
jgi:hypothetical protein